MWEILGCLRIPLFSIHGCLDCEHFPRLMLHYKKRKEIAISSRSLSLNSHNNEDARGTIFRLFSSLSSLPPSRRISFPRSEALPFSPLCFAHSHGLCAKRGERTTMAGLPKHSGNHHRSNSITTCSPRFANRLVSTISSSQLPVTTFY